jgi:hypothetical protein
MRRASSMRHWSSVCVRMSVCKVPCLSTGLMPHRRRVPSRSASGRAPSARPARRSASSANRESPRCATKAHPHPIHPSNQLALSRRGEARMELLAAAVTALPQPGCDRLRSALELSCPLNQEACVAWTVKVTDEYAVWFTALIKQDLDSATQVAQAVAALREEGPDARPSASGPAQSHEDPPSQGVAARIEGTVGDQDHLCLRPHPVSAAAPGRRQGGQLDTLVPRQHPASRTALHRLHR